jgi:hypothetical protein
MTKEGAEDKLAISSQLSANGSQPSAFIEKPAFHCEFSLNEKRDS